MGSLTRYFLALFATVLAVPLIGAVYAQDSVENDNIFSKPFGAKILKLDDTLTPSISATLTGLSLTGASFLLHLARGDSRDEAAIHVELARKSFINAFFMFLVCTVAIFVFDFLEILYEKYVVIETLLDILITYAFFAAGIIYLVKAARKLYFTYGR